MQQFITFKLHGNNHGIHQYLMDFVHKFWPDAVCLCRRETGTDVYHRGSRIQGCQVLEIYQGEDGYLLRSLLRTEAPRLVITMREGAVDVQAEGEAAVVVLEELKKHPLWR